MSEFSFSSVPRELINGIGQTFACALMLSRSRFGLLGINLQYL